MKSICWLCHLAYCGILKEMSLEELVEFILYSWYQAESSHGEVVAIFRIFMTFGQRSLKT